MILLSVILGLSSMFAYSAANVTSQPLVRKLGPIQVVFMRNLSVCAILGSICLTQLSKFAHWQEALLAFAIGLAGYVPLLAFMQGLKVSRVGIVAPLGATSALITVILAFVILHSPLHDLQWLAIALVVLANIAISVNPRDLKNSNVLQFESGVLFGLVAALGWGGFYFGLIYPTRAAGPWVAAFMAETGVAVAAYIHLRLKRQKISLKHARGGTIVGSAAGIVVGTSAYTLGVYHYNVGVVACLSNSTALLSSLLAAYFLKERLTRFEQIVAAAMIIGVVLVSLP